MKKLLLSTAALVALSGYTSAQEVTGGLTLSFGNVQSDNGGLDMQSLGMDGRAAVKFDNGVTIGGQVGKIDTEVDGTSMSLGGEFWSVEGDYSFSNGLRIGGFAERLTASMEPIPFSLILKTNGITVGYGNETLDVEAFVGRTSVDPSISGIEAANRGVLVKYTGLPGTEVSASVIRADIEGFGGSGDITVVGAAATHALNEAAMLFGGYSKADTGLLGDMDSLGIGVAYDLTERTGFGSTVSLELARTDMGEGSADTVRIGWTIPLGKAGPALPMNSVADAVLNPRHGAFNAALTAAY
jgi:hypothetical protein